VYPGIGYNNVKTPANNRLLSDCEILRSSIATCQGLGKKILLSIGGATNTYKLNSDGDAILTANFLWGAFGPGSTSWGRPRPFDYLGKYTVVDGFDFDIEHTVAGLSRSINPGNQNSILTGTQVNRSTTSL
jgi:chitinase